jgi:hypothetical protein
MDVELLSSQQTNCKLVEASISGGITGKAPQIDSLVRNLTRRYYSFHAKLRHCPRFVVGSHL